MQTFPVIDRPKRNRRSIHKEDMEWDSELEAALLLTLEHGKAIQVPLSMFHSSPAKGRLWKKGFLVHHRVLKDDKDTVAAWLEEVPSDDPVPEIDGEGQVHFNLLGS